MQPKVKNKIKKFLPFCIGPLLILILVPLIVEYNKKVSPWNVSQYYLICFFCNSRVIMKLTCALVLSNFVLKSACRQFVISQVENTVAEIKDKFDAYVNYHADNHTDAATFSASADMSTILPRQSTPYWYEEITHQGISAFGPSGYVVYRNVKDYGATGISTLFRNGQWLI
jgi:hypothetical protein